MYQAPVFEIGTRLRRARREKRLTLGEVAQALGYSRSLVSNIERGLAPKRWQTLEDIAKFVGADIADALKTLADVQRAAAELTPHINAEESERRTA